MFARHCRRSLAILFSVMFVAIFGVASVGAQPATPTPRTVTEAQVNSTYRVTNPIRRAVTSVHVNLLPGQVQLNATITLNRNGGTLGGTPRAVNVLLTPTITNARVTWTVNSITVDGAAATAEQTATINTLLGETWRAYFVSQYSGAVTALTLTDNNFTITFGARRSNG